MSARLQENLIAGLVLCTFLGYLIMSFDLGPNARLVPLPFALLGGVLILAQLIRQNLRNSRKLGVEQLGSTTNPATQPTPATEAARPEADGKRELQAVGIILVVVALIYVLGPLPAVFAFSAGYLWMSRHYGPGKSVAVAIAFTAGLYLLFVVALRLQLYHGIFTPLLDP